VAVINRILISVMTASSYWGPTRCSSAFHQQTKHYPQHIGSYLACRIGHLVPIWQPSIAYGFQARPLGCSDKSAKRASAFDGLTTERAANQTLPSAHWLPRCGRCERPRPPSSSLPAPPARAIYDRRSQRLVHPSRWSMPSGRASAPLSIHPSISPTACLTAAR
jgi:hypothetical protein